MSVLLDSRAAPVSSSPFLGISRSITGRSWRARSFLSRDAQAIAERNDLPELLGRVLAARAVALDDVETYLNPTLRRLMPQPGALVDMEKGADRLARAIMQGERIGTISDYDVDGVSSAALLTRFLASVGAKNTVHIPDRLTEGYGPSRAAVQSLRERGTELLLTLDCGVLAHDPLAQARTLGMDVIIVDHHQAGATLPDAFAVINPNRQDDISGFGYLCACGVAMILVSVVNRLLRQRGWYGPDRPEPNMLQWLELVALATVCDVVPLTGLNRAYVTQGLKIMARRENPGLAALADVARLKRRPDAYALAFLLGPRLNAAGRIGHANLAFELLVSQDRGRCSIIAAELERLNRERQAIEMSVLDQALREAEAALGADAFTACDRRRGRGLASRRAGPCRGASQGALQPAEPCPRFREGQHARRQALAARSQVSIWATRCGRPSMPVSSSKAAAMPWRRDLRSSAPASVTSEAFSRHILLTRWSSPANAILMSTARSPPPARRSI